MPAAICAVGRLIDPKRLGERLEATPAIDRLASPLYDAVRGALQAGPVKDALHGVWLGHPLHPPLTDLPIGFWTSAWTLDLLELLNLLDGRRTTKAAETLVGLGVACALPTAVTGLADWSELPMPARRAGAVHAVANATATVLYGASYVARRRGHRGLGVTLGMVGAAAATAGGFLGGHLVYRRASGVSRVPSAAGSNRWNRLEADEAPRPGRLVVGHVDGDPVVMTVIGDATVALADTCTHLGGPLHEGTLVDGCVRCPWHGSTFRFGEGAVVRGPAVAPEPVYEVREEGGTLQARRRAPG
jgi:nitrite reductase/ring-hydroxylating ferredoxin subunit/uncharacterized membrane protein